MFFLIAGLLGLLEGPPDRGQSLDLFLIGVQILAAHHWLLYLVCPVAPNSQQLTFVFILTHLGESGRAIQIDFISPFPLS